MIELSLYIGWLKVAEALLNPLGEDDDDFECNFLIDRNLSVRQKKNKKLLQVGIKIVDFAYDMRPEFLKDIFWDREVTPLYSSTTAAEQMDRTPLAGSAAHVT